MYFLTNIATENFTNEKTNSGEYIDLQKLHTQERRGNIELTLVTGSGV